MPRETNIWQVTEPLKDFTICPACNGWGGEDHTVCHGFGAREDWHDCFLCGGSGQITEKYYERIKDRYEDS